MDDSHGVRNSRAGYFNRECRCVSLDRQGMVEELSRRQGEGADWLLRLIDGRPQLFAESPVFVDEQSYLRQTEIIAAIERVVAMPGYQELALAYAPATARLQVKASGVFLGYDFHPSPNGPQLIEINTNAGGGLLNDLLARSQRECRDWARDGGFAPLPFWPRPLASEGDFINMFLDEWRSEKGDVPLRSIAIVDETPEGQFMYPEFLMFRQLFIRCGIDAIICDPSELSWRGNALWHGLRPIDMLYNRLIDFGLETQANACLLEAYLSRGVVVTPHPRAHALYADKRNLALMTDKQALCGMGVDAETIALLTNGIPHTSLVRKEDADELWGRRKKLFFKPVAGYGGKGAYRGDKLTRRVFNEILQGDYVAQALVPPGERRLQIDGELATLKFDVRHYVYRAEIQLTAARIYQGQTTNFRTPGGGFAPVAIVPGAE
ncbi:MAG: hypothetical protein NTX45_11390 [Proteobacteria bacterium]|nr:hypothetical protein [Pseudomonadota bacterium]